MTELLAIETAWSPPDNIITAARERMLQEKYKTEGEEIRGLVIVMKLTGACNIKCSYCYATPELIGGNTSTDLAINTIAHAAYSHSGPIVIDLHGGEPLLMFDRIKTIVEDTEQRPYAWRVRFNIQTNALLLNRHIARYLHTHKISIGISLDGRGDINDILRKDHDGKGTFDRAMKAIEMLREENIPFGVISILTKVNHDKVIEMFEFYKELNLTVVMCNALSLSGRGNGKIHLLPSPNEYFESSKRILDWMIEHNSTNETPMYEWDLSLMVQRVAGILDPAETVCHNSPCGIGKETISVTPDGSVYPCDWLVGLDEYNMGNIKEQSLSDIMRNDGVLDQLRIPHTERVLECRECELNTICSGGCLARNILAYGREGITRVAGMCAYYMQILPYIKSLLEQGVELSHISYPKDGIQPPFESEDGCFVD